MIPRCEMRELRTTGTHFEESVFVGWVCWAGGRDGSLTGRWELLVIVKSGRV